MFYFAAQKRKLHRFQFGYRWKESGKSFLPAPSTSLAKARAKQLITKAIDGRWEAETKEKSAKNGISTIGACVDLFLNGDQHVRPETAKSYVKSLFLILLKVKEWDQKKARVKKIDVLTDTVIRDFQAKKQNRESVTFVESLKINTAINSNVRQARSVFSRRALVNYEKAGMSMPSTLEKFLKAPGLKEVSHKYSDNPIPQAQIDKMNKALPKRSDGEIPVPEILLDWFSAQEDDYLILGKYKTARYNIIYRDHNKFVRRFILNRQKGNHELRKWAGSVVAQKTNSWERAVQFLRIDLETAKAHYLSFTEPAEALSLEDL